MCTWSLPNSPFWRLPISHLWRHYPQASPCCLPFFRSHSHHVQLILYCLRFLLRSTTCTWSRPNSPFWRLPISRLWRRTSSRPRRMRGRRTLCPLYSSLTMFRPSRCLYIHISMYIYLFIYVIYMYIYIYIYIYSWRRTSSRPRRTRGRRILALTPYFVRRLSYPGVYIQIHRYIERGLGANPRLTPTPIYVYIYIYIQIYIRTLCPRSLFRTTFRPTRCLYIYVCMYIYMCVCVYTRTHMYIYTYMQVT